MLQALKKFRFGKKKYKIGSPRFSIIFIIRHRSSREFTNLYSRKLREKSANKANNKDPLPKIESIH